MSRYTKSMTQALQQVGDRTQEFDEAMKWEVKISGLPTFYSDGKSRGEVKQALRKLLKRPDDIVSIERTTPAELKKIRRGQAAGTEPGEEDEEPEKVKEEVKINRIIEAQNKDLSVDDVINMIQFGHPFKVTEEIPAELPGPEVPRYKNASNATVDKEDKKANKIKDKAEKGTLIPTQTKEEVEVDEASATGIPLSKALAGITTPPKQKKGFRGVGKPPEAGWKTRKAGQKAGDMTTAEYDPTLEASEGKLPSHLAKFFDKKGDLKPDAAKRVEAGRKKRADAAAKPKITDVTPKGYGPSEDVEMAIMSIDHKKLLEH